MPGNLYGVSQPGFVPAAAGNADVACGAGADTVIITTGNLIAPSSGNWFPLVLGFLAFLCGAGAPTALALKVRVQGQAFFFNYAVAPGLMVANGTFVYPAVFAGNATGNAFFPGGSILEITANPTTNAITFKGTGSGVLVGLFHGPDV